MNRKKSKEKETKKLDLLPKKKNLYISFKENTELRHDDIIQGLLEDAFTPKNDFKQKASINNSNKSDLKPLGDVLKIDCQTVREVMKKLLGGEDVYDAKLRGNAIAHTLHCNECRNYMRFL